MAGAHARKVEGGHERYDHVVKRWASRLFLSLVLGAIVTIAVAWRCFLDGRADQSMLNWSDNGRVGLATAEDTALVARHALPTIAPPTMAKQQVLTGYRLRVLQSNQPGLNSSQWYRAGWPMFAVSGEQFRWRPQGAARDQREYAGMIVFRDKLTWMPPSIPYLPVRPIWPGFAINTLFYAAILWMLFAAPFALQRWRRIKRGLCPKCAYPVGTSDKCTECGTGIRAKAV